MPEFTVTKYSVHFTNCKRPYVWIMLTSDNNTQRVKLDFCPMEQENVFTRVSASGGLYSVDMNVALLGNVIDILRNEKPISVTVNLEDNIFLLNTGDEPIGEEESKNIPNIMQINR